MGQLQLRHNSASETDTTPAIEAGYLSKSFMGDPELRTEIESLSDNSNASLLSTGDGRSAAAVISTNGITDGQLAEWPQLGRGNVARKESVYRMFIVDILDIVSIIFQIIS